MRSGAKIISFPSRPPIAAFGPMKVQIAFSSEEWAAATLPQLRRAADFVGLGAPELTARLALLTAKNPNTVPAMIAEWQATVEHLLNVIEVLVEAVDRSEAVLPSRASNVEQA